MNIDEIIQQNKKLTVIVNAHDLLELNDNQYAMYRNAGFGASDSSKLLGINPFSSKDDLIKEKLSLKIDPEISLKASVRKGKELEDMIMHKAEKLTGLEIHKPLFMYGYEHSKLTVNFDGVTIINKDLIPFEIKLCTTYGKKYYNFDKSLTEDISIHDRQFDNNDLMRVMTNNLDTCGFPQYYYTQLQQQIAFLDAPYGVLVVLDDACWTTHLFVTTRNEEMIESIFRTARENEWCIHPLDRIIKEVNKLKER